MITPAIPGGSNFIKRLETLYLSGEVKRSHTVPTLRLHTIAEHVYGSILIGVELCRLNHIGPQNTMITLLYHDAAELETGDTPAPVKRFSREIKDGLDLLEENFALEVGYSRPALLQIEEDIVKASDTLDLMFKCVLERRLGNRTKRVEGMMNNVLKYIEAQRHIVGVLSLSQHLAGEWAAS